VTTELVSKMNQNMQDNRTLGKTQFRWKKEYIVLSTRLEGYDILPQIRAATLCANNFLVKENLPETETTFLNTSDNR